jgi:hypothetical protein
MSLKVKEDMLALDDGLLAKIKYNIEPIPTTARISAKQGKGDGLAGSTNQDKSSI